MLGVKAGLLDTGHILWVKRFELAGNAGVAHRWMHHGIHVVRLHLLLGVHRHVGKIRRYEGLVLVRLRIVENRARGVHPLSVKPKRLLDLLNSGLTLTMRDNLPSREFLHLNKKNISMNVIARTLILRHNPDGDADCIQRGAK